jgi:hypothetical protein
MRLRDLSLRLQGEGLTGSIGYLEVIIELIVVVIHSDRQKPLVKVLDEVVVFL